MLQAKGGDTAAYSESDIATSSEQSASRQPDDGFAMNDFLQKFRIERSQQEPTETRFELLVQKPADSDGQNCLWNVLREAMIDAGMRAFDYIQIRKETLNCKLESPGVAESSISLLQKNTQVRLTKLND
jgi:hypothetical protein